MSGMSTGLIHDEARQSNAGSRAHKVGWTVDGWLADLGGAMCRSRLYQLMKAGDVLYVKSGRRTIIITRPGDYLAALQAGSETHAANRVARFGSHYPSGSPSQNEPEAAD